MTNLKHLRKEDQEQLELEEELTTETPQEDPPTKEQE